MKKVVKITGKLVHFCVWSRLRWKCQGSIQGQI